MHKPEYVLENEIYKIVWDFEILSDHLILARRWHLIIINENKRSYHIEDFDVSANHWEKIKGSEKRDKYLDFATKLRKVWNKSKGTGRVGNWRMNWDYSDYSIVEISQNAQKNFGDLGRLPVTQSPMKYHQLMLVWKTHKQLNNNWP